MKTLLALAVLLVVSFSNRDALGVGQGRNNSSVDSSSWLRGSGDDLEIKIWGSFVDEHGNPLLGCKMIRATKGSLHRSEPKLDIKIEKHKFEIWVPVHRCDILGGIALLTHSEDGKLGGYKSIGGSELRHLAINGLKFELNPPTRYLNVKAIHQGIPIPDAKVCITGIRGTTNKHGIATIPIYKSFLLCNVGVLAEPNLVGGFSLDPRMAHADLGDELEVELFKCRSVKVKTIDAKSSDPVGGVNLQISIGTAHPVDIGKSTRGKSYIDPALDCLAIATDRSGEAVFNWLPDWNQHTIYVNPVGTDLRKPSGIREFEGDEWVVYVEKIDRSKRRRTVGEVLLDGKPQPGVHVEIVNYPQEGVSDRPELQLFFADENGQFAIDIVPHYPTSVIRVLDKTLLNEKSIQSTFFHDPWTGEIANQVINVVPKCEVELVLTAGPDEQPLRNQSVSFTQGRRWSGKTDRNGVLRTVARPGTLQIKVSNENIKLDKKINVKAGEVTTAFLNCDSEGCE